MFFRRIMYWLMTHNLWPYGLEGVFGGKLSARSKLFMKVIRRDEAGIVYDIEDCGLVGTKLVTQAFVQHIIDTLQSTDSTFADYKQHVCGTGAGAETNTDDDTTFTGISSTVAGTQVEGASANIYKSVATITPGAGTYQEHGIFNNATPSSGILLDRTVHGSQVLGASDSIEYTYELTITYET
jgi:hypothetical protein